MSDGEWIVRKYASPQEAADACERKANREYGASGRSDGGRNDKWAGTPNLETALEKARTGWSDIRPEVDAILEPIREKLMEKLDYTQVRGLDLVGFEPDISLYLAGELECMIDYVPREVPTRGKVFTLLINGTVSWMIKPETILARGAAIAALVEAFQMLGYDLAIWVENSVDPLGYGWGQKRGEKGRYSSYTVLTHVHRAGDPLDINKVMFPIGNPSWLRRIVFGIQEGEPPIIRDTFGFLDGGYGRPTGPLCDEMVDASFVMSMNAHHTDQDITDPVGWVLEQLAAQGVYRMPEDDSDEKVTPSRMRLGGDWLEDDLR